MLEVTFGPVVLRHAVLIMLFGPVDDAPPVVGLELHSRQKEILPSIVPLRIAPVPEASDHIGVNTVGVFMNIEGFITPRDSLLAKSGNQGLMDFLLELRITVVRINESHVFRGKSFGRVEIRKERLWTDDKDINIAFLANLGVVRVGTMRNHCGLPCRETRMRVYSPTDSPDGVIALLILGVT